jgi:hypothetical protein
MEIPHLVLAESRRLLHLSLTIPHTLMPQAQKFFADRLSKKYTKHHHQVAR